MFKIIKTKAYLYWNRSTDTSDIFFGKPIGNNKIFPLMDKKYTDFILNMNGQSWELYRTQVVDSPFILEIFPNLSTMPLN